MKLLFLFIVLFSFSSSKELPILRVFNFNDYIDNSILVNFAKENKIKIRYEIYENNDELREKIKNDTEGFDLACPSSNFISILAENNLISEINASKLNNFKNINPIILKKVNDNTKNYFIPYFWGTIGIIYDKTKVKPINSWNDLWREDLKDSLLFGSDYRDMFGLVLKSLGYSPNSQNEEEISKTYEKLLLLIPNIKAISSDTVSKYFLRNNFVAGIVFNGDAKIISDSQNKYVYSYPKEGVLGWVDSFVILKNGKNPELAYKFLDYILEPKNGLKIANTIGYATANVEAYKLQDKITKKNAIIYPENSILLKNELLHSVKNSDALYKKYWDLFLKQYKASKGN
ncbi:MAG: spermidine/putrescine ABC transporter substrate-binding protein [Arcobacteraceae bacterium]|nr:spermidine/putrescine ABC transporter substrate-binding protein [Arcobacteraceae bacterium]